MHQVVGVLRTRVVTAMTPEKLELEINKVIRSIPGAWKEATQVSVGGGSAHGGGGRVWIATITGWWGRG